MTKKYDAVIVMSNYMKKDGELGEDCRLRTHRGIECYLNKESAILLMSGSHFIDPTGKYDDTCVPFSQAEAMKRYAIKNGVSSDSLLKEEDSLDTVGQTCFCKWFFGLPKNWKDVKEITADYHKYRVEKIAEFIYGPKFSIDVEGVKTGTDLVSDLKEKEEEKLKPFRKTFEGIAPGDDKSLFNRLFLVHGRYNDGSDKNKELYQRIISLHQDWKK